MSCINHPTVELKYTCPQPVGHKDHRIGCTNTLHIDKLIVPLLQSMWKRGIHTIYSCQGEDGICQITMVIDEYKKFMRIVTHVTDFANKLEEDWYNKVTKYKTSYHLATYLNRFLFDFPEDEDVKKCNINIEVDVTVLIPHKDLDLIIHK